MERAAAAAVGMLLLTLGPAHADAQQRDGSTIAIGDQLFLGPAHLWCYGWDATASEDAEKALRTADALVAPFTTEAAPVRPSKCNGVPVPPLRDANDDDTSAISISSRGAAVFGNLGELDFPESEALDNLPLQDPKSVLWVQYDSDGAFHLPYAFADSSNDVFVVDCDAADTSPPTGWSKEELDVVCKAIRNLNERVGDRAIELVPYDATIHDRDYLVFAADRRRCESFVGRLSTYIDELVEIDPARMGMYPTDWPVFPQEVWVQGCASSAKVAITQHEIMHSMGFVHEQARPDSDTYVRVKYNNIIDNPAYLRQFQPIPSVMTFETNYDYGSIMHYTGTEFIKPGLDPDTHRTLVPIDGNGNEISGIPLGVDDPASQEGATDTDVYEIKQLYGTFARSLVPDVGGTLGDPYVQLPGVADPVFIDMPTDGTPVELVAHDAGLRVSGTAFAVAGDESGMSWMGSVRFQTYSSTPFALVPVDPQGAGANLAAGEAPVLRSVALRVNDGKENAPIVADEVMMLPGGFNVTCSEVAADKATCTVLSANGDEVIVTAQPAPSKFATDANAHKHMHLDLRLVQIAPGAGRTEGLFSDQLSEVIKAALARRRRRRQ